MRLFLCKLVDFIFIMTHREILSAIEKDYIMELVKDNSDTIENKKSDMFHNLKKKKVWQNICEKFNTKFNKNVQPKTLNQLYRKLKMVARKESSAHKKELKKTGGGPSTSTLSTTTLQILDLDENINFTLDNEFDDDAEINEDSNNCGVEDISSDENTKPTKPKVTSKLKESVRKENLVVKEHNKRMEVLECQKEMFLVQKKAYDAMCVAEQKKLEYYAWLTSGQQGYQFNQGWNS